MSQRKRRGVDNSRKRVSNEELLAAVEALRTEMNKRFLYINPYIEFLHDANAARKIAAWVFGFLVSLGSMYLLIKQVFKA